MKEYDLTPEDGSPRDIVTHLQAFAKAVETADRKKDTIYEEWVAITLLVASAVVTGYLSPRARFEGLTGAVNQVLTASRTKRFAPSFPATDAEEAPLSVLANVPAAKRFDTICLRNAYVLTAPGSGMFSFFLVNVADVTGFSFGYRPPKETTSASAMPAAPARGDDG